ncbi:MAG: hypothetical protein HGA87_00830 [Desulfobulbaceae bacterium]|nr:hypothetical protein [Desulfobulbaceae bacterium]
MNENIRHEIAAVGRVTEELKAQRQVLPVEPRHCVGATELTYDMCPSCGANNDTGESKCRRCGAAFAEGKPMDEFEQVSQNNRNNTYDWMTLDEVEDVRIWNALIDRLTAAHRAVVERLEAQIKQEREECCEYEAITAHLKAEERIKELEAENANLRGDVAGYRSMAMMTQKSIDARRVLALSGHDNLVAKISELESTIAVLEQERNEAVKQLRCMGEGLVNGRACK